MTTRSGRRHDSGAGPTATTHAGDEERTDTPLDAPGSRATEAHDDKRTARTGYSDHDNASGNDDDNETTGKDKQAGDHDEMLQRTRRRRPRQARGLHDNDRGGTTRQDTRNSGVCSTDHDDDHGGGKHSTDEAGAQTARNRPQGAGGTKRHHSNGRRNALPSTRLWPPDGPIRRRRPELRAEPGRPGRDNGPLEFSGGCSQRPRRLRLSSCSGLSQFS